MSVHCAPTRSTSCWSTISRRSCSPTKSILDELGENLITASSATEALEQLLKHEIAVVLVDVCMPELDGFELAAMIRQHPRFQKTSIIFVSAVHADRARSAARLRVRRRRLRAGAGRARDPARQGQRLRRAVSQDPRARAAERRARAARRASAPRRSRRRPRRCRRRTGARTSSWRCSRTSCAIRWRRSAPPCSCCGSRSCAEAQRMRARDVIERQVAAPGAPDRRPARRLAHHARHDHAAARAAYLIDAVVARAVETARPADRRAAARAGPRACPTSRSASKATRRGSCRSSATSCTTPPSSWSRAAASCCSVDARGRRRR